MKLPLISIIIPVYNAEKTIGRAIKSILNQAALDFELILINDGSKDNSLQVMKELEDSDPRVRIFNLSNSGVSYARNYGIEHARGKYITFLDADDYYEGKALEGILSEMDEETQLIIFGYNINYENKISFCRIPNNECLKFSIKKHFREYVISLIRNEMINAPWNKIYLTNYIKENNIQFDPNLNIGEDLIFNLSIIRDVTYVKIVNKALVNYTVKKGEGLVSQFRVNRFDLRYNIILEIKELLSYWDILLENQPMIDRMLIRDIMGYFMDFYKSKCNFSYDEKLERIKEIISRKEIKEVIVNNVFDDLSTRIIGLILRTNNSMFILLSAKIFNTKRAIR